MTIQPSRRRGSARFPHDQGAGQRYLFRTGPLASDPGQQHLDRPFAGLDDRQLDCGQGWIEKLYSDKPRVEIIINCLNEEREAKDGELQQNFSFGQADTES